MSNGTAEGPGLPKPELQVTDLGLKGFRGSRGLGVLEV